MLEIALQNNSIKIAEFLLKNINFKKFYFKKVEYPKIFFSYLLENTFLHDLNSLKNLGLSSNENKIPLRKKKSFELISKELNENVKLLIEFFSEKIQSELNLTHAEIDNKRNFLLFFMCIQDFNNKEKIYSFIIDSFKYLSIETINTLPKKFFYNLINYSENLFEFLLVEAISQESIEKIEFLKLILKEINDISQFEVIILLKKNYHKLFLEFLIVGIQKNLMGMKKTIYDSLKYAILTDDMIFLSIIDIIIENNLEINYVSLYKKCQLRYKLNPEFKVITLFLMQKKFFIEINSQDFLNITDKNFDLYLNYRLVKKIILSDNKNFWILTPICINGLFEKLLSYVKIFFNQENSMNNYEKVKSLLIGFHLIFISYHWNNYSNSEFYFSFIYSRKRIEKNIFLSLLNKFELLNENIFPRDNKNFYGYLENNYFGHENEENEKNKNNFFGNQNYLKCVQILGEHVLEKIFNYPVLFF